MISKFSVKILYFLYWIASYVFFLSFIEFCKEKKKKIWRIWVQPLKFTSFRFKFVQLVVKFNIMARIVHTIGIIVFICTGKLETWEQLFGICILFFQIGTAYALHIYTKTYMELIPIGNGLVSFNAKLASYFNVPLLVENDGLEIYCGVIILCYFGFCIPTLPMAFFYLELYDSKMIRWTITALSFFMPKGLGEFLLTAIHMYFGVLNGLFLLMGMLTVGYPNFINGWLELLTRKEYDRSSISRKIQLLKIYRAHQVQQNIADELYSKLAPTFYMFSCVIYIYGCVALILFYHLLNILIIPALIGIFVFAFFAEFGLQMLGNTQNISKRFANSLNKASGRARHRCVRKFYKALAKSCPPLRWNNGDFGSAGSGTWVMIMDKIIVTGVVNFVLYFRSK